MTDQVQRLCELAKEGDLEAASKLVTLFHARIFGYLRRLCGNNQEAEDLTQKTFFKVWTSLANFEHRSAVSTWIYAIAHHVYLDWRRKKNLLDCPSPDWWETRVADSPSPFEDAAERDLALRLYDLVEQLEPPRREVVHLHYYEGLSIKEVAEVLNVATSTVKYRLREALSSLRVQSVEPRDRLSPKPAS